MKTDAGRANPSQAKKLPAGGRAVAEADAVHAAVCGT